MRGKTNGHYSALGTGIALVIGSLALGACGSTGSFFSSSPLDAFSSSPKATTEAPATDEANGIDADADCPGVRIRNGAGTLTIGVKPAEGEPTALDLRYQGSIVRTARECHINAGVMTMKVGIEGRVVTGPAGGPGDLNVPLRIAVVQEGPNPKTIASRFAQVPVSIGEAADRVSFTHIDPDIEFPLPQPPGLIDAYVVYVGFDPTGAPPERKKPVRSKARPSAKKPVAKPAG